MWRPIHFLKLLALILLLTAVLPAAWTAWRIYFDKRNAIDFWGKRRPGLYLEMFGAPEYVYHQESPFGRDIFRIGDALGAGSVAALVNGKVEKVADVTERKWRIINAGP